MSPAPGGPPSPARLRVHVLLRDLQPQVAAWLGSPTRARGYPPVQGQHALLVEVAPGLAIHRVLDAALRAVPAVEPGLLAVERQFGVLEVHADDVADVEAAAAAVLDVLDLAGTGGGEGAGLRPDVLFADVVDDVEDRHAVLVNRSREGSMLLPGASLLVHEVTPALFAALAANEAERAAPGATLVDVSIIGAAGRLYLGGGPGEVRAAAAAVEAALAAFAQDPGDGPVPASGGGRA